MPNSLCTYKLVGQLLNIARPAAQQHYFEAGIVVEMSMQCCDNDLMMLMLKVGEFLR
jgi:hypothetical protein